MVKAVCVSTVGAILVDEGCSFDLLLRAFGLPWRGFGLFWNLGRQNVSRFIGRDLFNGGGIVRFDCGKRLSQLGIGFGFAARVMSRCTD